MALTIATNLAAMRAQRQLGSATSRLESSYRRLSTGLRIERPSDDAAGLSVATDLKVNARIFSQGLRNVNDFISMANIAEGAMKELGTILTRIEELASQASNGVLANKQRAALRSEYNRIVDTTTFNGQELLADSNSTHDVQAGGRALTLEIANLNTSLTGDGTFAAPATYVSGNGPNEVQLVDLNNDGNLDILASAAVSDQITISFGNGDGSFKRGVSYTAGDAPWQQGVGDFNGDSIIDIAVASTLDGQVSILLGNANGTFRAPVCYFGAGANRSLEIRDVNGDGTLDFIAGAQTDNLIHVGIGNGDGSFQATRTYTGTTFIDRFISGDFNGDDILDIVATSDSVATFSILLGNSDGSFKARTNFTGNGFDVVAADFNGDGQLDVGIASDGSDQLTISLGNGNGTFLAPTYFTAGDLPMSIAATDLNGDGTVDVVLANQLSSTLSVLLGNGDGTFKAQSITAAGSLPYDITMGDINGDGVADLISTSYGDDRLLSFISNTQESPYLEAIDLRTRASALLGMEKAKRARTNVSASVGQAGSSQSRLHFIQGQLSVLRENYYAAASSIIDVDVAQESAKLVYSQILQQGAAAILSQAALQPQQILALLR